MADTDGQVRIIIDTNAKEAEKALNDVTNSFTKNADTINKASSVYNGYEKAVQDNVRVLRELALGGNQNTEGFKQLAAQTREYQKALQDANNEVNKATGGIQQQSNPISSLTSKLKGLAGAYLSIRGAQMAFNAAMQSVEAFREQERAIASLNTSLANAGVYSEDYSRHVQELAASIQNYSNYGDEAIIKAQALGQSFIGQTKITDELTKAVIDFAAATGMDLENAFTLVGKSIGSNTNALGRYGVELKKGMSDTQKMEAITKQLADRYTGSAEAMANASEQLKNAIGDLREEIGRQLNPTVERTQKLFVKLTQSFTEFIKRSSASATGLETWQTALTNLEAQAKNASGEEKKRLDEQIAKMRKVVELKKQSLNIGSKTPVTNKTPIKIRDDEFSSTSVASTSTGTTKTKAKEAKDAFERAQEAAQRADKAFKVALYQSGGNITPAVEAARKKMEETKTAVDNVQKAYENLTKNVVTKRPFEQLQYDIEQAKQNIINLASSPVVNLEAVRQAQAEYQKLLEQQSQINSYLQPAKGAYQQLNDTITELTTKLRDLAAENRIGTTEWINNMNALKQAQTELTNVNSALEQQGMKVEQLSKNISSSISSGIISTIQNGGNAFDAFSNLAVNALQRVLDKILEMAVIQPLLNSIGGAGGGFFGGILSAVFGSAKGNVFQNGQVMPYAKGGIVEKPTVFPMANGNIGLMGEAGAEAVMPLRRMSNGRLGVEASDNKSGQTVNVYNYSGAEVETRKRDDNTMDVFIKKFNSAMQNERTSSAFRSAYQRESNKGVQAV